MAYMEELAKALRHEDPELRERVARALAELEDPRATTPLIEALGDKCKRVQRAVACALYQVADERALDTFVEMLEDEDDSVRLWAAFGLQRVGDESAVVALIEALSDSYESVREQTVLALAKIGDRRTISSLIVALDDEDRWVRSSARICLNDVFGIDANGAHETAMRMMKEHTIRQSKLNEKLEKVLSVIVEMEKGSGMVRDDELYTLLSADYGITEDEAIDLIVQLMKHGLVYTPKLGYTKICA